MYKITLLFALFFVSLFSFQFSIVEAAATSSVTSEATTSVSIQDRALVESRVREYFGDIPIMIEIARCESNFRQFTDSGSVLRGGAGGGMVGVFQFFGNIHANAAIGLGFDINTLEGNLGYARNLYQISGTTPWKSCVPIITNTTTESDAQLLKKIDLLKQLISLLQQLLALQVSMRP